ncbi:mechanosensitive ion channel family protein, partial [Methanosaeta sp. UBA458]|uniref:mechanosensitive ion channel family protein n=1 Tax=Methanosaeta sp. UBA458 TaxID=1915561 RepID=UPI002579C4D4
MNEGTVEMLQSVLRDDVGYAISYGPIIIAAIAILIIGWIGGRILGKIVVKLLDSVGLDDILDKTFLGEAIRRSEMTTSRLLDLIARWFVYLISIVAAVDVLNIKMLSELVNRIVLYIPHVVAGLMVLLVGLIVGTIIMRGFRKTN